MGLETRDSMLFDQNLELMGALTYLVSGDKMIPQIQRINRTSGKIVSITEVV